MEFDLETYMEERGIAENSRQQLRDQAQHAVSCYGLNGEHIKTPFGRENLFDILMGLDRYMIDSNSLDFLHAAGKPENRNKAFILGRTVIDETENLKSLFFGPNVDTSNNNIFTFGLVGTDVSGLPAPYLKIDRLDNHYRKIFDESRLHEDSRSRAKRTDAEYLANERKHMDQVLELKLDIVHRIPELSAISILSPIESILPPTEFWERYKLGLIETIRSKVLSSFNNFYLGAEVVSFCYAALLLESDEVGKKTRIEFDEPKRRNVFGDISLIQNALWLKSQILSKDRAVKRMAEYIGMPEIVHAQT